MNTEFRGEDIRAARQRIADRYGPWTAHSFQLRDGVDTFDHEHWDSRLRRVVQIASDVLKRPFAEVRVLDLASLEGLFGIEFALQGSTVVSIEGRESNLEKVRFAKEVLELDKLDPVLDDVRNLSRESYGTFDLVLCLGILYHLDAPDVMDFARRMGEVCSDLLILDTHIALEPESSYPWEGRTYWGAFHAEHTADATPQQKLDAKWASLDNAKSFYLTRTSLCNLLRHAGFSSVYECHVPVEFHNPNWPRADEYATPAFWKNRLTLIALKGERQAILASPVTHDLADIDRPENPTFLSSRKAPGRDATARGGRGSRILSLPYRILRRLRRPRVFV